MEIGPVSAAAKVAAFSSSSSQPNLTPAEQQRLPAAVEKVNQAASFGENSELTLSVDPDTHRPVVKIIDTATNEVIRQIPPKYVLRLAEQLKQTSSAHFL